MSAAAVRTALRRRLAVDPYRWGLMALALLPLVVTAVRAMLAGWVPQGDDAIIAMKVRSVFSADPPVMGMRTTSVLADPSSASHHPGPLQFYLEAPFAALGGFSAPAILLAVVVINALAIVATVWVAARIDGPRTAVPVVLGLWLLQWTVGADVLVRPFNPYTAVLPMMLVFVSAWAISRGDLRVLWLYALAVSYVAQANLAFAPWVAFLTAALLAQGLWYAVRRSWSTQRWWRADDLRSLLGVPLLWATLVAALAWTPTVVELFTYSPDNAEQLWRYGTSDGAGISWTNALGYPLGELSPWGFGRFSSTMSILRSTQVQAGGVLVLAVLALAAVPVPVRRGSRRPTSPGMLSGRWALICFAASAWTLTFVPTGLTAPYWLLTTCVVSCAAVVALCVRAGELLVPRLRAVDVGRPVRDAWIVAVVVGCVLALFTSSQSWFDERRAEPVVTDVSAYLRDHVRAGAPVRIQASGLVPYLSFTQAVAWQADRDGFHTYFMTAWPYREDTTSWQMPRAPQDAVTVQITERKPDGSWSDAQPNDAGAITFPAGSIASQYAVWISIPDSQVNEAAVHDAGHTDG